MEIYHKPPGARTRWASFENPEAAAGAAARSNRGMKGSPCRPVEAGETVTLLDFTGAGVIHRIWMTLSERSPQMLRSLRLDMYWDHCETPAVSAPLGDFFGMGLGQCLPLSSCFFASPEGRSFNCFIPMPFRTAARITVTNESSDRVVRLYYDIDMVTGMPADEQLLYFHAHWRRERPNVLGTDFTILPPVAGAGRFLGASFGVVANPVYGGAWWGEGEVKMWIDDDDQYPTLCGTGTEDYIGAGWGQGLFMSPGQGCTLAGENGRWAFYRYHLADPVYFDTHFRATVQVMGGGEKNAVLALQSAGAPLIPIALDDQNGVMMPLYETGAPLDSADLPAGGCNFLRQDDWSATACFYFDQPGNALPPLQSAGERVSKSWDF